MYNLVSSVFFFYFPKVVFENQEKPSLYKCHLQEIGVPFSIYRAILYL